MAGRFRSCHALWPFVLLGTALVLCAPASAGPYPHVRLQEPGDVQPITLSADSINTWQQGDVTVLLLRGAVSIEHDMFRAGMDGGVVWIDRGESSKTGILHALIFADGNVKMDNTAAHQTAARAFIDIYTRGEPHFQAKKSGIHEGALTNDALYRTAVAERQAEAAPPGTVQQASAQDPAPLTGGVPFNAIPAASSTLPSAGTTAPPTTVVSAQPVPSGNGPLPPTIVPVPMPPANSPPPTLQPQPQLPAPPPPPLPGTATPTVPPTVPATAPRPAPPPLRQIQIVPRNGSYQQRTEVLPNGEQVVVLTGGIILLVRSPGANIDIVDIEADNVVMWAHGSFEHMLRNMHGPQGHSSREMEVYLQGDVELREKQGPNSRVIRANEVYYDLSRNVAIAAQADMEFKQPRLPDPVHVRAQEVQQLSPTEFNSLHAEIFSSRLPSDPGLRVVVTRGELEIKKIPKRSIFGKAYHNPKTGQPEYEEQQLFTGHDMTLRVEDVPIFYFPYIQGDANDPLGPLRNIKSGYNRIFGFEFETTWNVYDLLGMDPIPGTRWDLEADYLSARGPALGTNYDYAGDHLFDWLPGKYVGTLKAYGIDDTGPDIIGGNRGANDNHPELRGRLLWRQYQELPDDFTVYAQVGLQSDKNFLEQYFLPEFQTDVDEATFLYVKKQDGNAAATFLAQPNVRPWLTETEYLPRVDGFLIGQSLFDIFTYNGWASATYAILHTPNQPPPPAEFTQQNISAMRLDTTNELSLPFAAGPFKLVPYVQGDVTYYTRDLDGNDVARLYGAVGLRASIPFTRLYPDIQSSLLNLDGINHKIVASANLYHSTSSTTFTELPQFDMLNDPITDQALRDMRASPFLYTNPAIGPLLASNPLFDPQYYALHQLLDSNIDTRDSIDAIELDLRQRWQTKRGYPSSEHIVDWMTLDLSATFFPDHPRANGGVDWALFNYDWTWNIGDRTALVSSGLFEPVENGARVFNIGAFFNRPDRTNFYLGYRQIDPLQSKTVTAAVSYVFSPKYAMTASSTYDFGTQSSLSNALIFTRMGSDFQLSAGITYNAVLNTFGVMFDIIPNVANTAQRVMGGSAFGSSMLGR